MLNEVSIRDCFKRQELRALTATLTGYGTYIKHLFNLDIRNRAHHTRTAMLRHGRLQGQIPRFAEVGSRSLQRTLRFVEEYGGKDLAPTTHKIDATMSSTNSKLFITKSCIVYMGLE